uniref:Iodothyronine deiodinase n=1 Tax=Clytia hemisphaerica TaxID=252671 RepID=A0A7M5UVW3_9CNID
MSTTKVKIAKPFVKVGLSVTFALGLLALRLPFTRRPLVEKFAKINRLPGDITDESLFSKDMQKTLMKCQITHLSTKVKKGKPIKDYKALRMLDDGSYEEVSLHNIQRPDQEQITQHKSIEDRIAQASKLQKTYPTIPVYVDEMSNKLNNAFGAFPERLYVLLGDVVVYQGGSTPINYSIKDLEKWIAKYVSKMEKPEKSMLSL